LSEHDRPSEARPSPFQVAIPSDPEEARRIQDEIEAALRSQHCGDRDVFCIKLAVEEAIVNAMKHGNQMDRAKKVRVCFDVAPGRFDIEIADEGGGFDPEDVPDPTAVENLERPCGRGVMLMRHYMTQVAYNATGNVVRMTKVFSSNGNGKK